MNFFVNYTETYAKDYVLLERESHNIQAALSTAQAYGWQADLVRGVQAFYPFLEAYGLFGLADQLLQQARQAAQALGDATQEVQLWHGGGNSSFSSHSFLKLVKF